MLCTLYQIKPHPIFREPVPSQPPAGDDQLVGSFDDQKKAKEPTTITVSRTRLDPNSIKVLFKVLEGCSHIQTLKYVKISLSFSNFSSILGCKTVV